MHPRQPDTNALTLQRPHAACNSTTRTGQYCFAARTQSPAINHRLPYKSPSLTYRTQKPFTVLTLTSSVSARDLGQLPSCSIPTVHKFFSSTTSGVGPIAVLPTFQERLMLVHICFIDFHLKVISHRMDSVHRSDVWRRQSVHIASLQHIHCARDDVWHHTIYRVAPKKVSHYHLPISLLNID